MGERVKSGSPPLPLPHSPAQKVGFSEAFRYWVRLGFISFGGPAGQIAIMQRDLVDRKKWISQGRFLHALSYCMLLPGPEAQQLAIYIGWLLHGTWGGIVAGAFLARGERVWLAAAAANPTDKASTQAAIARIVPSMAPLRTK